MQKKQLLYDWRNLVIILRRVQPKYPEDWATTDKLAAEMGVSRSAAQKQIAKLKQNKKVMTWCEEEGIIFDPRPGEVTGWASLEALAEETRLSPSGVAARIKKLQRTYPKLRALFAGQAPKEIREGVTRELTAILDGLLAEVMKARKEWQ